MPFSIVDENESFLLTLANGELSSMCVRRGTGIYPQRPGVSILSHRRPFPVGDLIAH
jgi:hypothetical protein